MDGAIVADDNFANILLDIAVLRSLSIRIILVHGAGYQMRELSEQSGVPISSVDGTGTTDEETLNLALTAANRITHEVLEGLASNDLRACYTNAVIAHPFGIVGGVDRLYTGRVERVDTEFINHLLDRGVIPVIAPLGFDGDGPHLPRQLRRRGDRGGRGGQGRQAHLPDRPCRPHPRGPAAQPGLGRRGGGILQEAQGRDPHGDALEVRAQPARLQERRQPRAHHRRTGGRGAAQRDVLQRRASAP